MPSNPGPPRLLRGINDRAARMLLLERGPLSRSRLGELTGVMDRHPRVTQGESAAELAGLVELGAERDVVQGEFVGDDARGEVGGVVGVAGRGAGHYPTSQVVLR